MDPRGAPERSRTSLKAVPSSPCKASSVTALSIIFCRASLGTVQSAPLELDYDGRHSPSYGYDKQHSLENRAMPMIDINAPAGTFADVHALATAAAATVMRIEGVPDIPMFRENTAAFVRELSAGAISDV